MYSYSAYGLGIESTLVLPELVESQRRPDVCIRLGAVDLSPPPGVRVTEAGWGTPDQACMRIPGVGTFLVSHGKEIVLDPEPNLDESVYRLFILGAALGVLLHQRGFLVLHASAVVMDEGAVAFMGDKGQGKSTMVGELHRAGYPLLADDIVAVDPNSNVPRAYPGFPQLKLWPESVEQLGVSIEALPKVRPDLEKRSHVLEHGFAVDSVPVKRIFVLTDGDHEAIEPLSPQAKFMALVQNSYAIGILHETGTQASHFQQTLRVAKAVPVMKLVRRRSMELLPQVVRMIEESIAHPEG
jgi:hypothetical protein